MATEALLFSALTEEVSLLINEFLLSVVFLDGADCASVKVTPEVFQQEHFPL